MLNVKLCTECPKQLCESRDDITDSKYRGQNFTVYPPCFPGPRKFIIATYDSVYGYTLDKGTESLTLKELIYKVLNMDISLEDRLNLMRIKSELG